jgi:uncharacterized protein involved in type VI secretion and phage assembly
MSAVFLEPIVDEEKKEGDTVQGVALAKVTNNKDPSKWGRVKLEYTWKEKKLESDWARVASPGAGKDRGSLWIPEVGDEVLVAFDKGDINHPFVLGALWNGVDTPPEKNEDGKNDTKIIKTRSGHQVKFFDKKTEEYLEIKTQGGHVIRMDDKAGAAQVEIKDSSGQNKVTIKTSENSITIESGMSLKIKSQSIDIEAGATMSLKASGTLTIQGAIVKIN